MSIDDPQDNTPHEPWSPFQIEQLLQRCYYKLASMTIEYKTIGETAASSRIDYEVAFSKALLISRLEVNTEGRVSVDVHRAWATKECEKEWKAKQIAENAFLAQRQVLDSLRAQGEILRTLLVQSRGVQDPRQ